MISTVIIVLIILLLLLLGAKRGAARTILHFAAVTASALLSHFLGGMAAKGIYDAFIKNRVISNIEQSIASHGTEYAVNNSFDALPDGLRGLIQLLGKPFGVTAGSLQGRVVLPGGQTDALARTIEAPLGELTVFLLSVLCSAAAFVLLLLLFRPLIRLALHVFELPLLHGVNHLLGAVFGVLEGIVLVCFLANALYVLLGCTNPAALDNSALFGRLFYALLLFN